MKYLALSIKKTNHLFGEIEFLGLIPTLKEYLDGFKL